MERIDLKDIEMRELFPGFRGRFIHSKNMTFVHWEIKAGSEVPGHSHPHEQVVNMLEGDFELTVKGETEILKPGAVVIIPPDAEHSGKALTYCRIIDVFYPVREDYRLTAC
jgi:quercetin dioxygenase-like cupin family protein